MEQNWSARLRQGDEDALCEIIRQRTGYVSTILRNFSRSTLPPGGSGGAFRRCIPPALA